MENTQYLQGTRAAQLFILSVVFLSSAVTQAQEPFTFAVVGDTQGYGGMNWDVFPQIVEDIATHDPDLMICVGDLIGGWYDVEDNRYEWEQWRDVVSILDSDVYAVPGNHDFYGGEGTLEVWNQVFNWLPSENSPPGEERMTYWFDYGNSRFISILSNSVSYTKEPDLSWLESVLAESGDREHIFVYSHHPVSFSTESPHMGGTWGGFWQSLVYNEVDAFFAGHWHRYQPSQLGNGGDTWETIIGTGGGDYFPPWRGYQQFRGFLLVTVDGASVTGVMYGDVDGEGRYNDIVDEYVISSAEPSPAGLVARYNFDGGTLEDDAPSPLGRQISGSLLNGASVIEDTERGQVLVVDGDLGSMEAGAIDDYVLSINNDLTLSLFMRPDSPGAAGWGSGVINYGTADYYVEDEETNYSYGLWMYDGTWLLSFWEYYNGTNETLSSTVEAPLEMGQWHHVALTRSVEEGNIRFWVDGEQLGDPVTFLHLPTSGGRGMLYLGNDVIPSEEFGFDGRIDDVCIYNMTLGADEVAALAAGADCLSVVAPAVVEPEEDLEGSEADEIDTDAGSVVEVLEDAGTGNEDEPDMGEDLDASEEDTMEMTEDLTPGETGDSQSDSSSGEDGTAEEPLDENGAGDVVSSEESTSATTRSDGCQCTAVNRTGGDGLWLFMALLFLIRRRGGRTCCVS